MLNTQNAPKCENNGEWKVTTAAAAAAQRKNSANSGGVPGTEWSIVTGSAGFIGSHVAWHCLEIGQNVVLIDDLSGGFTSNLPLDPKYGDRVVFEEGSITDAAFIDGVFEKYGSGDNSIAFIYHLAAYAA